MPLITDHLARCIRTLESSLTLYRQAEPESIDQEVFRNAIVKGYELAQETSFKLLKRVPETSDIAETNSTPRRSKIFSDSQPPTAS